MYIVAHRGGPKGTPQNSIHAFKTAAQFGATALEIDVVLTLDMQPVLYHLPFYSNFIRGRDNKRYEIGKISWKQLNSLEGNGPRIIHLSEAIIFAKYNNLTLFIEPKQMSFALIESIMKCLYDFEGIQIANILTFATRKNLLTRARELEPKIRTSIITMSPMTNLITLANSSGADTIVLGWAFFNYLRFFKKTLYEKVEELHNQKLKVYGGIANNLEDIEMLMDIGVDGIFTDDINNVHIANKKHE